MERFEGDSVAEDNAYQARIDRIARTFADDFPSREDGAQSAERIALLCDAANDYDGACEMRDVAKSLRA